eukprot:TRINITY_DN8606_c0_g1_i1.p2 TRINITY_DN8606_c0_g1~~TRINITY_DN8606_c0_g1_i1.p2  ORF type:complete len:118 (+),score=29.12 TRINITY_DN8606_c0_g1_i1:2-355(+)
MANFVSKLPKTQWHISGAAYPPTSEYHSSDKAEARRKRMKSQKVKPADVEDHVVKDDIVIAMEEALAAPEKEKQRQRNQEEYRLFRLEEKQRMETAKNASPEESDETEPPRCYCCMM